MSNISFWESPLYEPHYVIIGAGFLGIWTAHELAKLHPARSIVILERDPVPYGASIRNAGFLSLGSVGEFVQDEMQHGTGRTAHAMRLRLEGIAKIKVLFPEGIGLLETGSNEESEHTSHVDRINHLLDHQVFVTQAIGTIFNTQDCTVDSAKLHQALIKLLPPRVTILSGVLIKHIQSQHEVCITTQTVSGREVTIRPQKIIACTNGFTSMIFPDSEIKPARNHILVIKTTQTVPPVPEYAHGGYIYMRKLDHDLVLVGGARHLSPATEDTMSFSENTDITTHLKKYLAQRLSTSPDQLVVEHSWRGIMGFAPNKQNLVQQHAPGIFSACACNGLGVAMTSVFAETVAKSVA